jgi:hypothetical protein
VPVRDKLTGKPGGTYGGGRYLLDTVKGADLGEGKESESMVLDLTLPTIRVVHMTRSGRIHWR